MIEGRSNLDALARRARYRLRRMPPVGCYEGFNYPNLWGEFCHWVRYVNRGPVSDTTWHQTVILLIGDVIARVPKSRLPDVTEAAEMETGEFHRAPEDGSAYVDRSMIGRAVWARLTQLAEA